MSHETNDSWWTRITRPVLEFPTDLAFLGIAVVLLSVALVQPDVYGTPLAVSLGIPLVFFAPGYALVALLFPQAGTSQKEKWSSPTRFRRAGVTAGERCALSFGVSVALLTPLGILFSLARLPFDRKYIIAAVAGFTLGVTVLAVIRRYTTPREDRLSVSVRGGASRLYRALFHEESNADVLLNLALALSVVVALTAVGFAVAAPQDGEHFSDLSLLTRGENGNYVAEGYPTNFTVGDGQPVVVELENHEDRAMNYTVVVQLQRVEQRPDGSARVVAREEIDRFGHRVRAGGTWRTSRDIVPNATGENLRVEYLLYKGNPPSVPTTSNADEHAHIWINVSE